MTGARGAEQLVDTLRSQGRLCTASGSSMCAELLDRVATDVEAGGVFAAILAGHEDTPGTPSDTPRLARRPASVGAGWRGTGGASLVPDTGGTWDAEAAWPDIAEIAANRAEVLRAALD